MGYHEDLRWARITGRPDQFPEEWEGISPRIFSGEGAEGGKSLCDIIVERLEDHAIRFVALSAKFQTPI